MALQINRSDVALFVPSTLLAGEFFYNSADDKLYVGNPDSTVNLVSANPVDIESRIASLESDTGHTVVSGTAPSTPTAGDLWFNTTEEQLYIYVDGAFQLANDPYKVAAVGVSGTFPVSSAEFFQHIRFTPDADETIEGERFIQAATLFAEQYTGRFFTVRTVEEYYDDFPKKTNYLETIKAPFILKGGSVNSIGSLKYYNNEQVEITVDASEYRLVNKRAKGHLYPAIGKHFPEDVLQGDADIVTLTYNVGTTPVDTPASVKSAILLIAASLFENRENEVVGQGIAMLKPIVAAKDLLHPYKVR